MVKLLRIFAVVIMILSFVIPAWIQPTYSETDALLGELHQLQGIGRSVDEIQAMQLKTMSKYVQYLWLVTLPLGIFSGLFWLALAQIIQELQTIKKLAEMAGGRKTKLTTDH